MFQASQSKAVATAAPGSPLNQQNDVNRRELSLRFRDLDLFRGKVRGGSSCGRMRSVLYEDLFVMHDRIRQLPVARRVADHLLALFVL